LPPTSVRDDREPLTVDDRHNPRKSLAAIA